METTVKTTYEYYIFEGTTFDLLTYSYDRMNYTPWDYPVKDAFNRSLKAYIQDLHSQFNKKNPLNGIFQTRKKSPHYILRDLKEWASKQSFEQPFVVILADTNGNYITSGQVGKCDRL